MSRPPLGPDARRVLWAQAVRALAYGFGSVLLGVTLHQNGFSTTEVGLVLAAVVAGTVLVSMAIGRWADVVGRRRCYVALYLALAAAGVAYGLSDNLWLLVAVALTGALSTEVVESGPFTSLEQAMLATELAGRERILGFGTYNAVATTAGSVGALAVAGPGLLRHVWPGTPVDQRFFILFVPVALVGAAIASSLSAGVEAPAGQIPSDDRQGRRGGLGPSRPVVLRLSGLFALDSFGGGFVVQAFIAYWLSVRFGASVGLLGLVFFTVGILQAASFLVASRLGQRFGLLPTMVFTHLPSNALLVAMAFAPNLETAIVLLLARVVLSQMDVPTRQAYVMALVDPEARTPAAAYTNTARYLVRPAGPALAGAAQSVALGAPFVIAGTIKAAYDLVLWRWFRHVPLPDEELAAPTSHEPDPTPHQPAGHEREAS